MIIQHNLASMGAFNQSKITAARKAKTSERLASGYRINRAADDAAGLSISQKMRAQIRGLAQANENIQDGGYLAVGNSNRGPFLTKVDGNGGIEWTYRFQCRGYDNNVNNAFLMQDGSGHVFLSIQSYEGNDLKDGRGNPLGGSALGGRDTIMLVIDPAIDPNKDYDAFEKKAYRVGGDSNEQISRLYPTSDGGYIGGNYTTTPGNGIVQSNNDGSVDKPPTTTIGTGHHRSFITKFDKDGNAERVLLFGDNTSASNSGENISQIIETSAGEYIVVGTAEITDTVGTDAPSTDRTHGRNIWVMKLDKNLTPIWSRSYGSSKDDAGSCVVETEKGFVIAGRVGAMDRDVTQKPGYSGDNAWVFMIDKDSGDIIWDEVHGGSGSDSFGFIFEDANGDILLGGNSSSNDEDVAGKNKGGSDAWFLKLDGETGGNASSSGGDTGGGAVLLKSGFIYLQVGAYSGNHFRIDYADMRTVAIFGNDTVLNVMSHKDAGEVISLCDRAINYVSGQRSRYGSYQNALEHLYAANAITGENVSTSESRIADADMADEMVAFSRDKILEQVNSAAMAQANMANQAVLKLLQGNA